MARKKKFESPWHVAVELIRDYVLRGDTLEEIMSSRLGRACRYFQVELGGYDNEHRYHGSSKIIVKKFYGDEIRAMFSLQKIYDRIKQDQAQEGLFQ